MSLKTRCISVINAFAEAFKEAFICLGLSIRTSFRPGVAIRSCLLCLLSFILWTWIFYKFFPLISVVAVIISVFIALGGIALGALPTLPSISASASAGVVSAGVGAISLLVNLGILAAQITVYISLITLATLPALYIFAIILTIRLALSWVLMGHLRELTVRHYPHIQKRTPSPTPTLDSVVHYTRPWLGLGITPFLLLVPIINGALLITALSYLNVRFLFGPALSGLANTPEQRESVRLQRGATTAFGLMIFVITLIPVLNLFLPILLGSGACHLAYRGLERSARPTGIANTPQVSLPTLQ